MGGRGWWRALVGVIVGEGAWEGTWVGRRSGDSGREMVEGPWWVF